MLIDIMNDLGLEQLVHFLPRESNTLNLILTSLCSKFHNTISTDKLDHDAIAGTLKVTIPLLFPRRKIYHSDLYENNISTVNQIPVRFRIQWIRIFNRT